MYSLQGEWLRVIVNYLRKGYVGEKKVQTFHKCFVWRELQVGAWDCVCGPASYLLTIAVEGDIWDKIGKEKSPKQKM